MVSMIKPSQMSWDFMLTNHNDGNKAKWHNSVWEDNETVQNTDIPIRSIYRSASQQPQRLGSDNPHAYIYARQHASHQRTAKVTSIGVLLSHPDLSPFFLLRSNRSANQLLLLGTQTMTLSSFNSVPGWKIPFLPLKIIDSLSHAEVQKYISSPRLKLQLANTLTKPPRKEIAPAPSWNDMGQVFYTFSNPIRNFEFTLWNYFDPVKWFW